jgi:predicted dehydrogenase
MIAHCQDAGVTLMIAHVLRFWPEYVEAVRLVESGAIGKLLQISCLRLGTAPDWAGDSWFTDIARSGGAVTDLAIHDFDFIRQLAGMPLRTQAMGDLFNVLAQFQLPDGVIAHVESGNRMPPGWAFRMAFRLVGDAGVIEFDGTGGVLRLTRDGALADHPVSGSRTFNRNVASADIDGYYYQIAEFIACIRERRPPAQGLPADARDALQIAWHVRDALA